MAGDRPQDDPFERVTFDESFVRAAPVQEATADERIERWRHVDEEHRRIIEQARAHVREQAARGTSLPAPERPRPAGRWAVVVVALLLIAFFVVRAREGGEDRVASADDPEQVDRPAAPTGAPLDAERPPAGVDASSEPIGTPAPVPAGGGPHVFAALQPDGAAPVAYDPCRPVHVVVNGRTAPAGADLALRDALAEVSAATGLRFVVDGPTTEAPVERRQPYQPDRYPGRWAPVLVAWSDPQETPGLAGSVAGRAGSTWVETPDGSVYVTGAVALDGPDLAEILATPGGATVARAIVQHELAHLVGLDHVDDEGQLMYPETVEGRTDFGAGDLAGLAALGTGACFPEV